MILHDIGKTHCYTQDKNNIGHFYGHPKVSADMVRDILKRLKYDTHTINIVSELVLYHDFDIKAKRTSIKRWLNKLGEDRLPPDEQNI